MKSSKTNYKVGDMVEFNSGGYGLILKHESQALRDLVFENKVDVHYGRPWRVRLPDGSDRWYSANSFKRKI